jgi:hypothetical protein
MLAQRTRDREQKTKCGNGRKRKEKSNSEVNCAYNESLKDPKEDLCAPEIAAVAVAVTPPNPSAVAK